MLLAQSPLLPRVAKTLNKKHNISLLPLINRKYRSRKYTGGISLTATRGLMIHFVQPYRCTPAWKASLSSRIPPLGTHHPASLNLAKTTSQRKKEHGSACFCSPGEGMYPFDTVILLLTLCSTGAARKTKHWHTFHHSSYLWDCPRSRDQPSRGPAVALVPPLLNSVSDMSSRLKVVDWLLLSLD